MVSAWGGLNLYDLPTGGHLWGREFQILPTGTMADADQALHGLIGVRAEPIEGNRCRYQAGAPLLIYPTRGTDRQGLEAYQDQLAEQFNAQLVAREA